ncbi:MAG: hypothetical protein K2X27_17920 [Candidatus Obscuribacterales bacterium]|nr:hypothetical protein [Candidatus Obscuribacterales bacterium]
MLDEKRKEQLIQILQAQEQTSSGLRAADLNRSRLVPFIRKLEASINRSESNLANQSLIVYWSSTDAKWIQPNRASLLELSQSAALCSILSEHRQSAQEEFCFLLIRPELSIAIYGYCLDSAAANPTYRCLGSFDARSIKRFCGSLLPYWEFIDPLESDKIDVALNRVGAPQSAPHFINSIAIQWSELDAAETQSKGRLEEPVALPLAERTLVHSSAVGAPAAIQSPPAKAESLPKNQPPAVGSDEFAMRIASYYPFPIASPYRTLESITNASEKYKEQLKLIENLLALLAGISLAISTQNNSEILADLRECIAAGVSMGHWRVLIRKCSFAWKGTSTGDIPLAKAISNLRIELSERGFGKAVEQLIRTRNDFAHHRGPTAESQIEKETIRLAELLNECISYTDFLCEHPIKIVRAIDVLPSGMIKMICLKAIGDHPALRQEELCLSRGFPKGHLILNAGDSNWLSLYPFLSQDICPTCGSMEIYHLDKWRYEKNRIQVRSFDRGHALESSEISNWLKQREKSGN